MQLMSDINSVIGRWVFKHLWQIFTAIIGAFIFGFSVWSQASDEIKSNKFEINRVEARAQLNSEQLKALTDHFHLLDKNQQVMIQQNVDITQRLKDLAIEIKELRNASPAKK